MRFTPTQAERLRVWRKRRGTTSVDAAAGFDVPHCVYVDVEMGRTRPTPDMLRAIAHVPTVTAPERLALLRRRSGMTLREVARANAVSHRTLLARERRVDPTLVAFWERAAVAAE